MRSNVCTIEKGTKDLSAILAECEKVAVYNGLDSKQALQLRLLCEELDGMLPQIIEDFQGELWIEALEGVFKIVASIKLDEISADKKKRLIDIAKDKKNSAAVGIVGKIRCAIEDFFLDEESLGTYAAASGSLHVSMSYTECVDYDYCWSLAQYRDDVKKEEPGEAWDELEKSVIASVADDVAVGVKGKQADIVIIKKFI